MALYHCELGFPGDFHKPSGRFLLRYTRHALDEARRDRHGDLSAMLPSHIDTRRAQLVELQTNKLGAPHKLVYRVRGSLGLDLVLAVFLDNYPWRVGTVWANREDDHHSTLNKQRYRVGDLAVLDVRGGAGARVGPGPAAHGAPGRDATAGGRGDRA